MEAPTPLPQQEEPAVRPAGDDRLAHALCEVGVVVIGVVVRGTQVQDLVSPLPEPPCRLLLHREARVVTAEGHPHGASFAG